jgi:hypothetical protein
MLPIMTDQELDDAMKEFMDWKISMHARPLPRMINLGSEQEIAVSLGLPLSDPNTITRVKESLRRVSRRP